VWLAALAILVGHAWNLRRVLPLIPPASASRSPSSDVLLGALPLPHAADRLDAWSRTLPETPGVVVAHAPADAVASAYMVIAMRLWPRPVSLVACEPTPRLEQFRVPHAAPAPTWRLDVWPGGAPPVDVQLTSGATATALCGRVSP
jgi:hypothetical protein